MGPRGTSWTPKTKISREKVSNTLGLGFGFELHLALKVLFCRRHPSWWSEHTPTALSQSTICRFESLTLSRRNMQALRPALEAWLAAAEGRHAAAAAETDDDPARSAWGPSASPAAGVGRRRRRTIIAGPERRSLEAYFAAESRPCGERLAQIADALGIDKAVVRVWYCNQRQKLKRLTNHLSVACLSEGLSIETAGRRRRN